MGGMAGSSASRRLASMSCSLDRLGPETEEEEEVDEEGYNENRTRREDVRDDQRVYEGSANVKTNIEGVGGGENGYKRKNRGTA